MVDLVNNIGLWQATVSGHLACLRDYGLADYRPVGRQSFYRLTARDVDQMLRAAEIVLAATGDAVVLCPTTGSRPQHRTRSRGAGTHRWEQAGA